MSDQKTELAKVDKKPKFLPVIEKVAPSLEEFFPDHIDPEKFLRVVNGVLKSNSFLAGCLESKKGKIGFFNSMKQAAIDGLVPDGKYEAAIVPFKGVPTYVRMYGGMVKMMRQSGEIIDIQTGLVYEAELKDASHFDFSRGTNPFIHHKEMLFGDRGKMAACWAVIRTKGGGFYFEVMGREDVMKIKNGSPAKNNGPWSNKAHEGAMWRKTVLRQAAKLAPISTDLQNAFAREYDQTHDFTHLQEKTPAQRLEEKMDRKQAGKSRPLIEGNVRQDAVDEDIDDAEVSAENEKKGVDTIELPMSPEEMGPDDWTDYTTKILKSAEDQKMHVNLFNRTYASQLDAMAQFSSSSYNRVLDAQDAAADAAKD